jgi:hypothetical protein
MKKKKKKEIRQDNSIIADTFTDSKTVTFEDSFIGNISTIASTISDDKNSFKTTFIEGQVRLLLFFFFFLFFK